MPTILDFINNQIKKTGVDPLTLPSLKAIQENESLKGVDFPIEIHNLVDGKLMTAEQAVIHPEVYNEIKTKAVKDAKAEAFDAAYGSVKQFEAEIQDKEFLTKIKDLPITHKLPRLIAEIKKQTAAGGNTEELVKANQELNEKIKSIEAGFTEKEKQILGEKDSELTGILLDSHLSRIKYGIPQGEEIGKTVASIALEKALKEKGAMLKREGREFKLVNAKTPELPYTENNSEVPFSSFLDKIIADNKLAEINPPQPPAPPSPPTPPGSGSKNYDNSAIDKALKTFTENGV